MAIITVGYDENGNALDYTTSAAAIAAADRKAEIEAEEVAEKTRLEDQRRERIAMLEGGK